MFQFTAGQSIDGASYEQSSDRDKDSNDGSVGSTGEKKKKYKSVFRRAFQKIKANKQQGKALDGTEPGEDLQPCRGGSLPPAIPKLDLNVELSPPKVATYLLEETGDDLLMQNRRTSNEFYKVRKASLASMGELSPRSNNSVFEHEDDEMVAEALLSARARGRRVSLGGLLEDTPDTTPDTSRRPSLAAGTWMADLQLARNHHLLQEALEKEVQKDKKEKNAKSNWKKAMKKVKKSRKKRSRTCEDTKVEKLNDRISEESSLHNSFNNSRKFPEKTENRDQAQNPVITTWNNLTNDPVVSGLTAEEAQQYAEKPTSSDNASLPSLRMGWIETRNSPVSGGSSNEQDGVVTTSKTKKKKKKSKKDKAKMTNDLHRTMSTDVFDDVDPKVLCRSSSGSEMALPKSMGTAEMKPKRRLSSVLKRAVSKISIKKEEKRSEDDNVSFGSRSIQGSMRSLQSDIEPELGRRSPGQGQRLPSTSALSAGSSDLLDTSDLDALSTDDEALLGLNITPVKEKNKPSSAPSSHHYTSGGVPQRPESQEGSHLDLNRCSPRPTSMYGSDDDNNSDTDDDRTSVKRGSANAVDQGHIHSDIPVIQVLAISTVFIFLNIVRCNI